MFSAEEAVFLDEVLGPVAAAGGTDADGRTCLVDDAAVPETPGGQGLDPRAPELTAVVYYAPEDAADRVWDLTMIAVRPALQGHGLGRALLLHVEQDLRDRGERLLLVDTSGTTRYDRTREFYQRCGYSQEARVRDYWEDGDDLVIFSKRIDTP